MTKVRLREHSSEEQYRWGGCTDTHGRLHVGELYEVEREEVHSWHTKLFLKGFPDLPFNSVCFDTLEA